MDAVGNKVYLSTRIVNLYLGIDDAYSSLYNSYLNILFNSSSDIPRVYLVFFGIKKANFINTSTASNQRLSGDFADH